MYYTTYAPLVPDVYSKGTAAIAAAIHSKSQFHAPGAYFQIRPICHCGSTFSFAHRLRKCIS